MLEPFEGYVVDDAHAPAVVTAPFDALTAPQRRHRASHPDSFLGALPPGGADASAEELDEARHRLEQLIAAGRFRGLAGPTLAVLTLASDQHELTGVVGDLPSEAFHDGTVRPHEQTDERRVASLAHYLEVVRMASSPVCVSHLPDPTVVSELARVRRRAPAIDLTDPAGRVRMWLVTDPAEQRTLTAALEGTRDWLLADGHHRAAAGRNVGRVLTMLVADDALHVRPFHRRVRLDEPERAGTLLRAQGLEVVDLPGPTPPARGGEVSVGGGERWWRILLPPGNDTTLGRLDVTRAGRHVLDPLLRRSDRPDPPDRFDRSGGGDPAAGAGGADPRVQAVPPDVALPSLPTRQHVGVALHPPTMAQIREVAAAGGTLPPKTTYIVPKQRSGLFVVPR